MPSLTKKSWKMFVIGMHLSIIGLKARRCRFWWIVRGLGCNLVGSLASGGRGRPEATPHQLAPPIELCLWLVWGVIGTPVTPTRALTGTMSLKPLPAYNLTSITADDSFAIWNIPDIGIDCILEEIQSHWHQMGILGAAREALIGWGVDHPRRVWLRQGVDSVQSVRVWIAVWKLSTVWRVFLLIVAGYSFLNVAYSSWIFTNN